MNRSQMDGIVFWEETEAEAEDRVEREREREERAEAVRAAFVKGYGTLR